MITYELVIEFYKNIIAGFTMIIRRNICWREMSQIYQVRASPNFSPDFRHFTLKSYIKLT